MAGAAIQVTGLKEVRKALTAHETESDWKQNLKAAFSGVANLVADAAQASAAGSRMGSKARGSIRGKATTTGASIEAGKGIPWYHGHEFGSHRYRQFPPVQQGGYHLYPAIDDKRAQIEDEFADAVGDALERSF